MEFNYNNEWFKDKLETIIDKEKFIGKGDDWQVDQLLDDHFGNEYGYYQPTYKWLRRSIQRHDLSSSNRQETINSTCI